MNGTVQADDTFKVISRNNLQISGARSMFQVVLVGPDHRSATCLRAMLDGHGDFESLAWLFQTCIPFFLHHWAPLHKNALLATESILVDCAPVQHQALRAACKAIYPNAILLFCFFHAVKQPFQKTFRNPQPAKLVNLVWAYLKQIFKRAQTRAEQIHLYRELNELLTSEEREHPEHKHQVVRLKNFITDTRGKYEDLCGLAPAMNCYTANSISTSRVEADHGAFKRFANLKKTSTRLDVISGSLQFEQQRDRTRLTAIHKAELRQSIHYSGVFSELEQLIFPETFARLQKIERKAQTNQIIWVSETGEIFQVEEEVRETSRFPARRQTVRVEEGFYCCDCQLWTRARLVCSHIVRLWLNLGLKWRIEDIHFQWTIHFYRNIKTRVRKFGDGEVGPQVPVAAQSYLVQTRALLNCEEMPGPDHFTEVLTLRPTAEMMELESSEENDTVEKRIEKKIAPFVTELYEIAYLSPEICTALIKEGSELFARLRQMHALRNPANPEQPSYRVSNKRRGALRRPSSSKRLKDLSDGEVE